MKISASSTLLLPSLPLDFLHRAAVSEPYTYPSGTRYLDLTFHFRSIPPALSSSPLSCELPVALTPSIRTHPLMRLRHSARVALTHSHTHTNRVPADVPASPLSLGLSSTCSLLSPQIMMSSANITAHGLTSSANLRKYH